MTNRSSRERQSLPPVEGDPASGSGGRIDLPATRLRLAGLLIASAGFAAACAWMLLGESGGRPLAAPGSLKQFFVACGLVLFGLGIPAVLRELLYGGGYWIAGQGVRGGTRAVLDAIAQVRVAS